MSFFNLPEDIRRVIAGFLLDCDQHGVCTADARAIDDVLELWAGDEPAYSVLGLLWPGHPEANLTAAIRCGNFRLMQYIVENGRKTLGAEFEMPIGAVKAALVFGYVPHLEWVLAQGATIDSDWSYAMDWNENMLTWVMASDAFNKSRCANSALYRGDFAMMTYFIEAGYTLRVSSDRLYEEAFIGAKCGPRMMAWLKERYTVTRPFMRRLILRESSMVDWLFENGCPWATEAYRAALKMTQ